MRSVGTELFKGKLGLLPSLLSRQAAVPSAARPPSIRTGAGRSLRSGRVSSLWRCAAISKRLPTLVAWVRYWRASAGVIPRKSSIGVNTQSSPAIFEPSAVLASRCRSRSARCRRRVERRNEIDSIRLRDHEPITAPQANSAKPWIHTSLSDGATYVSGRDHGTRRRGWFGSTGRQQRRYLMRPPP